MKIWLKSIYMCQYLDFDANLYPERLFHVALRADKTKLISPDIHRHERTKKM